MKNSEKIYLALIAVLSYVLYFKTKDCKKCPEVVCDSSKTIYVPTYIPSAPSQSSVPPPKEDVLQTALIYTGPEKFEIRDKIDTTKVYLYFVKDSKYFKRVYHSANSFTDTEITVQQMIDAWNSTK